MYQPGRSHWEVAAVPFLQLIFLKLWSSPSLSHVSECPFPPSRDRIQKQTLAEGRRGSTVVAAIFQMDGGRRVIE